MLGAIVGDMIGSRFERNNVKRLSFPLFVEDCRFTDDSVLTFAVADCVLNGSDYAATIRRYAREYPDRGYGSQFLDWSLSDSAGPYNSYGNGSAMRVSPIGFAYDSEETVLEEAYKSAAVTHDHPEGLKGAQAVALAVFLARTVGDKELIRKRIKVQFGYDLDRTIESIRPTYEFNASCQGSVPEAIIAFLDSENFEDAVRKAVSLGGDTDTIASMAGAIAQAYYKEIPVEIQREVWDRLPEPLSVLLAAFCAKYPV
ncbi:MAG: ADP-ribosylglycohydrolase family protein [Elusimicrobia bacterium]|nr:ADP-ribosylglycohydrolase family protein [Elusimicrobiota bacterium]